MGIRNWTHRLSETLAPPSGEVRKFWNYLDYNDSGVDLSGQKIGAMLCTLLQYSHITMDTGDETQTQTLALRNNLDAILEMILPSEGLSKSSGEMSKLGVAMAATAGVSHIPPSCTAPATRKVTLQDSHKAKAAELRERLPDMQKAYYYFTDLVRALDELWRIAGNEDRLMAAQQHIATLFSSSEIKSFEQKYKALCAKKDELSLPSPLHPNFGETDKRKVLDVVRGMITRQDDPTGNTPAFRF